MSDINLRRAARIRWGSYALLIAAYMLAYFHRLAPGVLASELQVSFSTTGTSLGILAATYFYAYTLMQIPAGVLADTLGTRRIVAIGCTLAGAGGLLFALADSLWLASIGRFLVGIGTSATFIAILKFVAQWFYERQFASVTGLTILLGNIGGLCAATPLAWSLHFAGWRTVMTVLAMLLLAVAVIVWLLVRDRPAEAGLPSMRELEGKAAHSEMQSSWLASLLGVLKNPDTWPGFVVSMGMGGTFFTLAGLWGVPWLRDVQGFDRATAAAHATWMIVGFAVGSFAVGAISDRLQRRKPVLLSFTCGVFACWIPIQLALPLPTTLSLPLFTLLGFFATAYTITLAATKEVNAPALSGMTTGVVNTGTFLGAAIMQPLIGHLMDLGWGGRISESGARLYAPENYQYSFLVMSCALTLSLIFAFRLRETHCRYLNR